MKTFREVIDLWPSISAFAADIGVSYVTAQVMRHRNSIAAKHWRSVVESAEERGLDVTYELLASLKAGGSNPPRRAEARAVA